MKRESKAAVPVTSLSDLQYRVMQVFWSREEATASEVQQGLADDGKALALTTVSTLLTRLARRELLLVRREGRQLFYRAAIAERDVRRTMVNELVGTLFAGDARGLLAHLVKETEVNSDDLKEIRRLLHTEPDDE